MTTKSILKTGVVLLMFVQGCTHSPTAPLRNDVTTETWKQDLDKMERTTVRFVPKVEPLKYKQIKGNTRGIASAEDVTISDETPPMKAAIAADPARIARVKADSAARALRDLLSPQFNAPKFKKPTLQARPRIPVDKVAAVRANTEARAKGEQTSSLKTHTSSSLGPNWYYNYYSIAFTNYDYVDNMYERYSTYYAPAGTVRIRVDFDWIDLELYDHVKIYDKYGLCASFSGYYPNGVTSNECQGDYVDIWVDSDSSRSGDLYDGFYIQGFQYSYTFGNSYPVATARANKYAAKTGESISFDASKSYDPDEPTDTSALQYYWTFGDGTTSTAKYPTKSYSDAGGYNVMLQVTDRDNMWSRDYFTMSISLSPPNAGFGNGPDPISTSNYEQVWLDSTSTADAIFINWGDGTSTLLSPYNPANSTQSHKYSSAGTYTIIVKAANTLGSDVKTNTVTVSGTEIPPYIDILNQTALNSQAGKVYRFTPCISFYDDGSVNSASIDWGISDDSNKSQSVDPEAYNCSVGYYDGTLTGHTYQRSLTPKKKGNLAGAFNATVTAVDNTGVVAQKSFVLTTKNLPPVVKGVAVKCVAKTHVCSTNITGVFTTSISDPDNAISDFRWAFLKADGVTPVDGCPESTAKISTCQMPMGKGVFYIKATAADSLGLKTSVSKKVSFAK